MPARPWSELTTQEMRTRDWSRSVAVLPVAAIEQHGPHLPLGTDAIIGQGYLDAAAALVPDGVEMLSLPLHQIGKSDEHDDFAGTLTLSAQTAIAAWTEIGAGVHRAGCTKLVVVSSHGGNGAVVELVTGELRARFGMVAVATSWSRLGYPEGLLPEDEIRHGIHAGGIETALMRALRPDLVRDAHIADFASRSRAIETDYAILRAGRPAAFAWKAQDLHPSGALGDARLGTAEIGRTLIDHGARRFVALLDEVVRFSL